MKILLVEGDEWLSAALSNVLEGHGYGVDLARDGQTGLALATTIAYDLLLLDIQLSGLDGVSLCRQLRSRHFQNPILLLTANQSDADVVAGLDAGADDYISQPYTDEVLLARVRTWLRRSGAIPASVQPSPAGLRWGKLFLDLDAGRVLVGDLEVALTATEYNLLELFLRNPDRIFSRSVILDRLWGLKDAPSDRAIVTYIKDVRKKLKASGLTDEILETVYGMGYRLKPAPQASAPTVALENGQMLNPTSVAPGQTAIEQVLEQFRDGLIEQATILEQANNALQTGSWSGDLHQVARQVAHKLAGSLLSFGYPEGSRLARSLESLLKPEEPFAPATIARFTQLVTALRQELAREPLPLTRPKGNAPAAALPLPAQVYRVLVIDDDVALTARLEAEAGEWGLRLEVATSPAEARSRLSQHRPDSVLLDLSFPAVEEDGLPLLQELTGQFPDLPVIVFTGRDSLVDRLTVFRSGARQFLRKPIVPEQIFRAIARVLSPRPVTEARVLIVDDDPGVLAVLSSMLIPWGLAVTTLSNPQEFWNVLVTTAPNLVLVDLEMPQISGLELCQVVRQDPQWEDLPLLVVTAHTDATSLQQAFAAGADDFITKPVLGPELVTRVISRIQRTRLDQPPGLYTQ
jgi:DNA-binding response OmpR family regulator